MPVYDISPEIVELSGRELNRIGTWAGARNDSPGLPAIVLIGGWAVDAYNPYLGSVDIDLVTNSRTSHSLMYHLQRNEGYTYDVLYPFGKTVLKTTPYGRIILDFISRESPYPFEGHRDIPFSFGILEGNTVIMRVRGGAKIAVPNRSVLVLLKLKAAWDRRYRLDHGLPFISEEHEELKWIKDCADLIALIDPKYGGHDIDPEILGRELSHYEFLKPIIPQLPEIDPARERYGRMETREIQKACSDLISII